jgi:hypothetical protein
VYFADEVENSGETPVEVDEEEGPPLYLNKKTEGKPKFTLCQGIGPRVLDVDRSRSNRIWKPSLVQYGKCEAAAPVNHVQCCGCLISTPQEYISVVDAARELAAEKGLLANLDRCANLPERVNGSVSKSDDQGEPNLHDTARQDMEGIFDLADMSGSATSEVSVLGSADSVADATGAATDRRWSERKIVAKSLSPSALGLLKRICSATPLCTPGKWESLSVSQNGIPVTK